MFGSKKVNIKNNKFINNKTNRGEENQNDNKEADIKLEDEWIWVEGYKGTGLDMKCREMQYELNITYT